MSALPLTEKYRPSTFGEVLAQPKVLAQLNLLRQRNAIAGRLYWIAGKSGTGKTTIARLIAREIADDFSIEEHDAGTLTIAKLRDIEQSMCLTGWGDKSGRAYIFNEAHGLRKDVIRHLLTISEPLPKHVVFIFTTTIEGEENIFEEQLDSSPLLSRCTRLDLAQRDLAQNFARRALEIAVAEHLGTAEMPYVVKLVQKHGNNMRAVLQAIEAGALRDL